MPEFGNVALSHAVVHFAFAGATGTRFFRARSSQALADDGRES